MVSSYPERLVVVVLELVECFVPVSMKSTVLIVDCSVDVINLVVVEPILQRLDDGR